MPPLMELSTKNFRSLQSVSVKLKPLNVLVGPNEAGKSNFLDVIRFLGDSVRDDLAPALEKRGGYDRVRFRGRTTSRSGAVGAVTIKVQATVTTYSSESAPDEYELTFRERRASPSSPAYLMRTENFTFKRRQGRGRRITISGQKVDVIDTGPGAEQEKREFSLRRDSLGLSTLPRLSPDEGGEEIARMASLFSTFRVLDIDVAAARRPSRLSSGPLEANASNLSSFLVRLAEDDEIFADYLDDARDMIPGLRDIMFEAIGGSSEAVVVKLQERGLRDATDLADASYGTIRVLALLAALYDPEPPMLTCIEEIDHGLHPYVFDRLVDRLRGASARTQFLIATHSPAFVNRLHPDELLICERDARGATRLPAISTEDVILKEREFGGTLRLGEIWFTGTLGGVPR